MIDPLITIQQKSQGYISKPVMVDAREGMTRNRPLYYTLSTCSPSETSYEARWTTGPTQYGASYVLVFFTSNNYITPTSAGTIQR